MTSASRSRPSGARRRNFRAVSADAAVGLRFLASRPRHRGRLPARGAGAGGGGGRRLRVQARPIAPTFLSSPWIRPARVTSTRLCTSPSTTTATWSATPSPTSRPTSPPSTALDEETRRRGETLYFPDVRVPLHPAVLSEGAASLLPDQVRAAVLWQITLDATGAPTDVQVGRARVRSRAQLDYARPAVDARRPAPRRLRPRCCPRSGGCASRWRGNGTRSTSTCPSRRSFPTTSAGGNCSGARRCRSRAGTPRSAC